MQVVEASRRVFQAPKVRTQLVDLQCQKLHLPTCDIVGDMLLLPVFIFFELLIWYMFFHPSIFCLVRVKAVTMSEIIEHSSLTPNLMLAYIYTKSVSMNSSRSLKN